MIETPGLRPVVTLTVDGQVFSTWEGVAITRDLSEGCASFELIVQDMVRIGEALPAGGLASLDALKLRLFQPCEIAIDGELVLKGHLEDLQPEIDERSCRVTISGRDVAGDLIDCAAAPRGPVEYRKIPLEDFVAAICAPFGIGVTVEVDTGEPLRKVSLDTGETAWSAIEKACRMRGVLAHSDGVGNVILTRSGTGQAPGPILFGTPHVMAATGGWTARDRFSDWYVKGQVEAAAGKRQSTAPISAEDEPFVPFEVAGDDGDEPTGKEARAVTVQGYARDEEVGRYRPKVVQTRASGLQADASTQAQWWLNTSRGRSDAVEYTVHGFRGPDDRLWRPNERTMVVDPYQDVEKELLIAGVRFEMDLRGWRTLLRVTGVSAFDVQAEGDEGDEGSSGTDEDSDVEMVEFPS